MDGLFSYDAQISKLMFIIVYFTKAFTSPETNEEIIFERRCIKGPPEWEKIRDIICEAEITEKIVTRINRTRNEYSYLCSFI